MKFLRPSADGKTVTLELKAVPGAKKTSFDGLHGDSCVRVRLQAPPVDGAANEALVEFLCRAFSLKASAVEMIKGEKSRLKTVRLHAPYELIEARLEALLAKQA